MPLTPHEKTLERCINADVDSRTAVMGLLDRKAGVIEAKEGLCLDFKRELHQDNLEAVGEIARDILAFSNTEGGVLLIGVDDSGLVLGHKILNAKSLREKLGLYLGTRVDFEITNPEIPVKEKTQNITAVVVRRSETSYPSLLRKDIEHSGRLQRKLKYLSGSLFYRVGNETRVEPVGGDIDARAVELGFTGATPRTRSSFVLERDTPGVRLYAHINDKFFGRDAEKAELVSKYDDPRGRGVSIAGQGGIGKTELGIEVTRRLFETNRFRTIYSGSAKTLLLGPSGMQEADPAFYNFPTFLKDLAAWSGLDIPATFDVLSLEDACVNDLRRRGKTLIFLDNLETIEDGRLFQFLDARLPENVWLLTTSRVHKIKNYILPVQLGELQPRSAAQLFRYELKRQGLPEYASGDINELEKICKALYFHPLSIRWFAWLCKRQPGAWQNGPSAVPKDDLEAFCISNTLSNLANDSLKVLSAICTTQNQLERLEAHQIEKISDVNGMRLDTSLYELETAGLINTMVDDQTGKVSYNAVPLALGPGKELARKCHWEALFVNGLVSVIDQGELTIPDEPLLRDLVNFDTRSLKHLPRQEVEELKGRVERVNRRQHRFQIETLHLQAECERLLQNPMTADDYYKKAATLVLQSGKAKENTRYQLILVEAATTAKMVSAAPAQLDRAIGYLESIETSNLFAPRILSTLAELWARRQNRKNYETYKNRAEHFRDSHRDLSQNQLWNIEETLRNAASFLKE